MIQLSNIGIQFSGDYLFRSLDWSVRDADRIGLVGDNGTGKSTLMKIIAGIMHCDEGEVIAPKDTTFGYLPQDGLVLRGNTVFQEVKSVFTNLIDLQNRIAVLEMKMRDTPHQSDEYDGILHEYDGAMSAFNRCGGYTMEEQIGRVLHGLGFSKTDWGRKTDEFSGGWQMRIALAKLLLRKPTVLLLDEPTNHLDLIARNWLEEYLCEYPGTVIVVSHDRFFLDVVVKRITALAFGKMHDYYTNYSGYITEHDALVERQLKKNREQHEQAEKLRRFINRYRADKKRAGQVSTRKKMLSKLEEELVEVPKTAKTVRFRFPHPPRSGLKVLDLRGVAKSYGANHVFKEVDLEIQRGDRVALVGENGAGKSTLMRILAGVEPVTSGERRLGSNVGLAFFDQDHAEKMDRANSVLEEVEAAAPPDVYTQLRGILGAFLFTGDDVDKRVSVLSGGERSRLTLAKMLLRQNNLLLLDEPTNHLDMKAKDVLLGALSDFKGTIVFVSHDRYFIDELAEKVIEVGGGGIRVYQGNYEDYLYLRSKLERRTVSPSAEISDLKTAPRLPEGSRSGKVSKNFLRKVELLEKRIGEREEEQRRLEAIMAEPGFYDDRERADSTVARYEELRRQISKLYERWTGLQSEIG